MLGRVREKYGGPVGMRLHHGAIFAQGAFEVSMFLQEQGQIYDAPRPDQGVLPALSGAPRPPRVGTEPPRYFAVAPVLNWKILLHSPISPRPSRARTFQ